MEHYFHFLFGYLIPFLHNVRPNDGNTYIFRDCGPAMNPILLSLAGYRTGILAEEQPWETMGFPGHDTSEFPGMDMPFVRDLLVGIFKASAAPSREVLVVDRGAPDPFYESLAEIPTSGSSKRSVPNMGEVFDSIRGAMPARLVFLEGMPLRDQICLFMSHRAFVMQHGAAMANLLFAPPGAAVLEIRDADTEDFYAEMRRSLCLGHSLFPQEHKHARVNPKDVLACLKRLMRASIAVL